MSLDHSEDIDYTQKVLSHGSNTYQRILQQNGATSSVISSSLNEVRFEIPSKVFRLDESYLSFEVVLENTVVGAGAVAGTNALNVGDIRHIHSNGMPIIQAIDLSTRSNLRLVDLTDADKYANMTWCRNHKMEDYLDNDQNYGGFDGNNSYDNGYMFHRSNSDGTDLGYDSANSYFGYQSARVGSLGGTSSQLSATEMCYFYQSVVEAGGNEARMHLRVKLPLGAYKGTLLECPKQLWMGGEVLVLTVTFNQLNKIGWVSDSETDLGSNIINFSEATTVGRVENIALYLSVLTNQVVANQLMKEMENGYSMPIKYTSNMKFGLHPSNGGGDVGLQQRINRSFFKSLDHVIFAAYHRDSFGISNYDHDNTISGGVAAKISKYTTYMDHDRLQAFELEPVKGLDYMVNKKLLKNSPIQSSDIFRYNFAHVDDWQSMALNDPGRCKYSNSSLDCTVEKIWSLQATATESCYWYVFMTGEKVLALQGGVIALI